MTTQSTAPAATHKAKRVPGEEGVWIFILGDICVFAVFFTYYLVQRGKHVDLFDVSQSTLNKNFGAVNTVFLLISSLFVVLAVRAMRAAERLLARRLIAAAFLCGVAFIVVKVFEYSERIAAHQIPTTNGFYLLYFVLTGLHLFHLILGLGVLTALFFLARRAELSKHQWAFFEGGACFWHMVDLLWLVLFPLIFLVR
ncbi:cytochrome C oxidase subunit III [Mycobacterium triplex]|uniref:Probable cytochrome c oxidase subunit 3 n=1 Tax=Mycobacterium triplex TaxID=47839 RepID=A0A024K438_9MYCO|nr:cytochrome c oxidase subunit 3 [Mycobacterium triplex]ORW99942.1 cytochrome C oxidase subunit III [Mycobacterium triplex]CDO90238.1 heme/copper-type cytochrome/quinol oxidase, subunit 3 [Mycobacterium triplex]